MKSHDENINLATQLYHNTCLACSTLFTQRYSTSFSLGIKVLDKKVHLPIYGIYGFVRLTDEIVDTFHQFDKKTILERLEKDTFLAIEEKISFNPILHSFQQIVHKYNIDILLVKSFFNSMRMDLDYTHFSKEEYNTYIYGSAEVVGLMCLYVFLQGDKQQYEQLAPYAKSLGAAFQKINFLRDVKSDFEERGRVYFPNISYEKFTNQEKKAIEEDIKKDFEHALIGIHQLPKNVRKGVFLTYIYYTKLLEYICKVDVNEIKKKRINVPNYVKKLFLLRILFA